MSKSKSAPTEGEVRAHLERVLRSRPFVRSNRLKRFLSYVVEAKLAGDEDSIQEYAIALAVFDRRESFDPRLDSIVRTEARRLRQRLEEVYAGAGAEESIRIRIPPPGYIPTFSKSADSAQSSRRNWALVAAAGVLVLALVAAALTTSDREQPDPRAVSAYEKGMAAWRQWTGEGTLQAERFFEEAIAIDPSFAKAYVGLSRAYRQQIVMGEHAVEVNLPKAINAVQRAIELDPESAVAHQAQGANLTYKPDWPAAERSFQRAIELEPESSILHHTYAITFLVGVGRLPEADREIRRAVELDPGSISNHSIHGMILYFQRRYDEAREVLEEALAIDQLYPNASRNLALVALQQGDAAEATRLFKKAQELSYLSLCEGLLAHTLAVQGEREQALELIRDLERGAERGRESALGIAAAYVGLGDHRRAFEWLERAWRSREMQIRFVPVDALYDPIRDDPRYGSLLEQMRLPASAD